MSNRDAFCIPTPVRASPWRTLPNQNLPGDTGVRPLRPGLPLDAAYRSFIMSRRAMRCTAKTLVHYHYTVGNFVTWLGESGVSGVEQISATDIRSYLITLQDRGLRDTTQHAHARGIKTWLNWLVEEEYLLESPMRKVAMPKLEKRVPPAFSHADVQRLLAACDRRTAIGARNYAIVLTLLDTGLRASEFTSLRVGDVDMRSVLATVFGKGQKQRTVRAGSKARSAILHMLAFRDEVSNGGPLWVAYSIQGRGTGVLSVHGLATDHFEQ